jgi:tetratricopeptide (TPR) repeat protein
MVNIQENRLEKLVRTAKMTAIAAAMAAVPEGVFGSVDYKTPLPKATETVQSTPDPAEQARISGLAHYENKEYQQAIVEWNKAKKITPNSCVILTNIGSAYNKLRKSEEALPHLKKAIEINPEYPNAHFVMGLAYRDLREYEKAKEQFEIAVKLRPGATNYLVELLNIQERLKKR